MLNKSIQLINNINPQIQESEWTSSKMCTKKTAPTYIGVKLLKTKD